MVTWFLKGGSRQAVVILGKIKMLTRLVRLELTFFLGIVGVMKGAGMLLHPLVSCGPATSGQTAVPPLSPTLPRLIELL
jgi:hypothetical protein